MFTECAAGHEPQARTRCASVQVQAASAACLRARVRLLSTCRRFDLAAYVSGGSGVASASPSATRRAARYRR
eukprot:CAMPEP_0202814946 /NCGR_PEP_ID=MMETSP1389-20130828/5941_1 /ASSEMBLY_ACC=CAM_ASM_000865 /TAXON_ID=302021 /ORGANISM="Rhodomonas sp., Strain CCMP768" /LENGTH=71 /DNA_ID=CAMNT_0049486817 /DNA_START=122 /DNA_END=334 /DNA_ORIENTATION=+